jgi:hypothetical protein
VGKTLPVTFNQYFRAHFYHILPSDRIGLQELKNSDGTIFAEAKQTDRDGDHWLQKN